MSVTVGHIYYSQDIHVKLSDLSRMVNTVRMNEVHKLPGSVSPLEVYRLSRDFGFEWLNVTSSGVDGDKDVEFWPVFRVLLLDDANDFLDVYSVSLSRTQDSESIRLAQMDEDSRNKETIRLEAIRAKEEATASRLDFRSRLESHKNELQRRLESGKSKANRLRSECVLNAQRVYETAKEDAEVVLEQSILDLENDYLEDFASFSYGYTHGFSRIETDSAARLLKFDSLTDEARDVLEGVSGKET